MARLSQTSYTRAPWLDDVTAAEVELPGGARRAATPARGPGAARGRSPRTPSTWRRSSAAISRTSSRRCASTRSRCLTSTELTLAGGRRASRFGRLLSSCELTEAVLRRIDETEPLVHAYATVMAEQALAAAVRADDERARGKSTRTASRPPVRGQGRLRHPRCAHRGGLASPPRLRRPAGCAGGAERFAAAARVLVGKLVTHEFCCGQDVPPTRNAWNVADYPGGSSAGAGVAVAVGSTLAALGTDAGGSVRKPASLNGVVGLKPTYGLVSMGGVFAVAPSLDHVGTVTRTVDDCRLVLGGLVGPVDAGATTVARRPPRRPPRVLRRGARAGCACGRHGCARRARATRSRARSREHSVARAARFRPA